MAAGNIIPTEYLGLADVYSVFQDEGGRSPFERLLDEIRQHEGEEEIILEDYERTAAGSSDAGVRYLIDLIVQDEKRHAKLAKDIAQDMTRSLLWTAESGKELPVVAASGEEREALLAKTHKYLHLESEGLTQLQRLEPRLKELRSGMMALLFQIMEADTRKHIQILKYIEKRLEAAA
ncbi:MAG: hypothetical protein JO247_06080 [Chloroflexi bacterium]|nr:hypothetical protein [Chloroflexota bacterium]